MALFTTELFAHFVYSPKLSYHELLGREEELKIFVSRLVEEQGGDFLHFEATGDALRAQCVFPEYHEDAFHALCDVLASEMNADVEARLLFVSKELDHLHLYALNSGKWKEAAIVLPPGPIAQEIIEESAPSPEKVRGRKKG